jgi:phosphate transport system permease protein
MSNRNNSLIQNDTNHLHNSILVKRSNKSEFIIEKLLFLGAASSVIIVFFIIFFLLKEGFVAFEKIGTFSFIFGTEWVPVGEPERFGAFPLIVGSLLVTIGAMLFAIPLGIAGAIFISEIAPYKVKTLLKPTFELLAGIPSVVFGFFGLKILTDWLRVTFNQPTGESWLAGSILLGIMALPTIISVSEDAISAVPREFKEGSLAIGATKWQTINNVIIPAAISGITASIILGMGRAVGETMAVLMVTGNSPIIPEPITNIFSSIRTITGTLGIEMGEVPVGSIHYSSLFGLGVILFVMTLLINIIASISMSKIKQSHYPTAKKTIYSYKLPQVISKSFYYVTYSLLGLGVVWTLYTWFGIIYTVLIIGTALTLFIFIKRLSVKNKERLAFGVISLSAVLIVFILGVIVFDIVSKGLPAISWEFLTQTPYDIGRKGGIFPAIIGTLYLVAGAILFALPIGVLASIYLTEYAKEGNITKIIRSAVDNLNGTPSIVFGLFGFAFLVLYLNFGISLIAGQLSLGFMVLPTIIRTTEEALRSVPKSLREGSLAVGATKWHTIQKVVLPPALPGIITGTVLSIGRAAGETAPILFTAAVFSQKYLTTSPFQPVMALPYHLYILATNVPGSELAAYGTALVLLIFVIILYAIATLIRLRYWKTSRMGSGAL